MSSPRKPAALRPAVDTLESRELLAADFIAGVSGFPFPTDQLKVTYTTKGFTGNFDVAVFRSKDTVLDPSDFRVAIRSLSSNSSTATQTSTLNFNPALGSDPVRPIYIIQLNPDLKVPEANNTRANNTWFFTAPYNQAIFTDAGFRDTSSVGQVGAFLTQKGSYFRNLVLDTDNKYVNLSAVIVSASQSFRVNPKLLLTLLQNQVGGVTSGARPNTVSIMGNAGRTWAQQVTIAAQLLDQFFQQAAAGNATSQGWRRLVTKSTLDGISVVPNNNAMTALFSYTPYAGPRWGGNNPNIFGMYRFTEIYRNFGF